MDIYDYCELSADELEKVSDEEWTKRFAPFFNVTRPEQAAINKSLTVTKQKINADPSKAAKIEAAIELARRLGINIKGKI